MDFDILGDDFYVQFYLFNLLIAVIIFFKILKKKNYNLKGYEIIFYEIIFSAILCVNSYFQDNDITDTILLFTIFIIPILLLYYLLKTIIKHKYTTIKEISLYIPIFVSMFLIGISCNYCSEFFHLFSIRIGFIFLGFILTNNLICLIIKIIKNENLKSTPEKLFTSKLKLIFTLFIPLLILLLSIFICICETNKKNQFKTIINSYLNNKYGNQNFKLVHISHNSKYKYYFEYTSRYDIEFDVLINSKNNVIEDEDFLRTVIDSLTADSFCSLHFGDIGVGEIDSCLGRLIKNYYNDSISSISSFEIHDMKVSIKDENLVNINVSSIDDLLKLITINSITLDTDNSNLAEKEINNDLKNIYEKIKDSGANMPKDFKYVRDDYLMERYVIY